MTIITYPWYSKDGVDDMELTDLITIVTLIITWFLGHLSKKSKFISNNLIPLQNLLIGVFIALIEWIITKDFKTSIALSGILAGGSYDILHNLDKMIRKGK